MDENLLDRREFLMRSLAAALTASGMVLVACSGGGGSGPGGGSPCTDPVAGDVASSGGHSHSIEDVCSENAGTNVELRLSGSGHSHTLSLSSSQVDQILAGNTVNVTSSSDSGHSHPVSFN